MGKPKKMASPLTKPKSAIPKLPKAPVSPLKLPKPAPVPAVPASNMTGQGRLVPPMITGTSNMALPKPKKGGF